MVRINKENVFKLGVMSGERGYFVHYNKMRVSKFYATRVEAESLRARLQTGAILEPIQLPVRMHKDQLV